MSCSRNGLQAAQGAVRSGIGRISSKAVFYSVLGLTLGGAAGLLLRRVPGRAATAAPNEKSVALPTLSGPEAVLPLRLADVAGGVCAACGSSGDSKPGSWYRLGGSRYCQDCAPRQAKQTGVVLSAVPKVKPAPTLSTLATYWPRRATTLEPVTIRSGPVSNLAGYAVLAGGKQSGLSLMPEVKTDRGQVRIDDKRWFVNYDRANKPLAGPFKDLKQAQTAASLLCNFNWNRAEAEFSAVEVASLKAMLVDFRKKQQPQSKKG